MDNKLKTKSSGSNSSSSSSNSGNNNSRKAKTKPIKSSNPSTGVSDNKRRSRKRGSLLRKLASVVILHTLGYYFFIGCGSPYDTAIEKPAICEPINTIKLDIISLFETDYYKENIKPFVDPIQDLYNSHAKELINEHGPKIQAVYHKSISPKINEILSKPVVKEKCEQMNKIYTTVSHQVQHHYKTVLQVAQQKYKELPPPVQMKLLQIKDLWHKIELVELKPILVKYYWVAVDFYQEKLKPYVMNHPYFKASIKDVKENKHIQHYYKIISVRYKKHIHPIVFIINRKLRLNKLFIHVLKLFLPQRPEKGTVTVGSSIAQPKTSAQIKHSNQPIAKAITSSLIKSSVAHVTPTPKTVVENTSVKATLPPVSANKQHNDYIAPESTTKSIKSTPTEPTVPKHQEKEIHKEKEEGGTGGIKEKAKEIVKEKVVEKAEAVVENIKEKAKEKVKEKITEKDEEEVKEEVVVEQGKQEAKEEVVEQDGSEVKEKIVILKQDGQETVKVAADKDVFMLRDERDLFELSGEKELFEVNKQPLRPSKTTQKEQEPTESVIYIEDQVIYIDDQVIIPPPPPPVAATN